MVSNRLRAELHGLNRAEKLQVVQLLVNELASDEEVMTPERMEPPSIEDALDAMAADPDIQREIA